MEGLMAAVVRRSWYSKLVHLSSDYTTASITTRSPKKRTRKKKGAPSSDIEQTMEEDRPPRSNYPFHGRHIDTNETTLVKKDMTSERHVDLSKEFMSKEDTTDGRYYVFKDGYSNYKLPSVTTILQATLPRSSWFSLRNWRLGMIQEHGEEGFMKWRQQVVSDGQKFHTLLESKLNRASNKGTRSNNRYTTKLYRNLSHKQDKPVQPVLIPISTSKTSVDTDTNWELLYAIDNGFSCLSLPPSFVAPSFSDSRYKNYRYMESVKNVLSELSNVMVTEGVVRHTELGYSGTVDCVAKYRNKLCVIDWKTSNKLKPTLNDLYDYPLQTVAYAGAINSNVSCPYKVENVLIVVAYPTGAAAHAHFLDSTHCLEYWDKWLDRLDKYQTQFAHDLSDVYV